MTARENRFASLVSGFSALILAISFVLPLTGHTTYLNAAGNPAGFLAQLFPSPDAVAATSYGFVWDDMSWTVSLIFFLPALLLIFRNSQNNKLLTIVAGGSRYSE